MKSQTGIPAHSNVAVQLHSYVQSVKSWIFIFAISVTRDEVIGLLGVFEAEAKGEKMDRSKFRDFLHKEFGLTEDIMLDRGWCWPSFQEVKETYCATNKITCTIYWTPMKYHMTFCAIIWGCEKTHKQTKHVLFSHGKNHWL